MGVGFPADLLEGIARGVDLFDCVAATRNGRHGTAWLPTGRVNVRGAALKGSTEPLDPECDCETCTTYPARLSAAPVRGRGHARAAAGLASQHPLPGPARRAGPRRTSWTARSTAGAASGSAATTPEEREDTELHAPGADRAGGGLTVLLLQMAAIGLVFYFLILRPVGPGAEEARRAAGQPQEGRRGDDQRRHHRQGAGHQGGRVRRRQGDAGHGRERHRDAWWSSARGSCGSAASRRPRRPRRHEPAAAAPARLAGAPPAERRGRRRWTTRSAGWWTTCSRRWTPPAASASPPTRSAWPAGSRWWTPTRTGSR